MEVRKRLFILQNKNRFNRIIEVFQLEDGNYIMKNFSGIWISISENEYSEMSDSLKQYLNE